MKRRVGVRIRLVRSRRSYDMRELAGLLGVHERTVQSWHKKGMLPIDPESRPYLFKGSDIKTFLSDRRKARKCNLADGEFYCPRCRTGRTSNPDKLRATVTDRRMGRTDRQVLINGVCSVCGCRLTMFQTIKSLKRSFFERAITGLEARLRGNDSLPVNTDFQRSE